MLADLIFLRTLLFQIFSASLPIFTGLTSQIYYNKDARVGTTIAIISKIIMIVEIIFVVFLLNIIITSKKTKTPRIDYTMNLIILAIVLISTVAIAIAIRRSAKMQKKNDESFWDREHEANFTRKKSISDLNYINIPEEILSLGDSVIAEIACKKILNLNGIQNTDLKLTYGAANITELSEYDQNYTDLITRLDTIATKMLESKDIANAKTVLVFATDISTDILRSWEQLANIYVEENNKANIHILIKKAENIKTFRGPAILRRLNQILDIS